MENTGNGWKVNRVEAIQMVGLYAVENVEAENCEWASGGGQAFGEYDTTQTWKAYLSLDNNTEHDGIYAIYYVEDSEFVDDDGETIELDNIIWLIDHYVID